MTDYSIIVTTGGGVKITPSTNPQAVIISQQGAPGAAGTGGGGGGVTDGDKGDVVVTGSGATWTIDPSILSAQGRALIDDTDAAAQRTTLGLGSAATQPTSAFQAPIGFTPENAASKGAAGGYAGLDGTGKVPSSQLPSFVDDVLEFVNLAAFPVTGSAGLIYVTLDTNRTYRWSGAAYIEISASPGSTDSVAEGSVNLYFTAARVLGVVLSGLSTATNAAVTAADTILSGIGKLQAQFTAHFGAGGSAHTAATTIADGFMSAADKTKLNGVATGATANATDAQLRDRSTHTGTQTAATISDFAEATDDRVAALLVAGSNVTLTYNDATNTFTIAAAGGGGSLVSGSDFLTSGTSWTTPADITAATKFKMTIVGAGGGGAGCAATANLKCPGGGAGGVAVVFLTGLSPSTSYTTEIGTGGTGGAAGANAGGRGVNSSITISGTTYTANGGAGALSGAFNQGGTGGTTANIPAAPSFSIQGGAGGAAGSAAGSITSGHGGASGLGFGPGGANRTDNAAGVAGVGYGSGGGGASTGSATARAGGNGAPGCILIEWQG